jgi:uncharacterized membrane protein (UPF0182 family)
MRGSVPRVGRRGKVTLAVVSVIILILLFLDQLVALWTNWLWFEEVGYTSVFGGILRTRIWLFLLFGLVVGGFVAGNLYLAYRLRPLMRITTPDQQALERYRMLITPRIGVWIGLASGAVGLFAGLSGQARWSQWMLFQNRVDFGVADPEFGTDIGFYVFELPFWRYLLDVGFTTTALAVLGATAAHYLYGGVRLQGPGDRLTTAARAHLTSLVALFVLLKAAAYFLDRRTMLLKLNAGTDTWGAGYTDINAVLPAKEILAYISILVAIAILVFANIKPRSLTWAGASLALLGISAVAIGGVYPMIVQQVTVNPNRPTREAPYIERSIQATRAAFGIDNVKRMEYLSDVVVPPASLATDTTVVPTIRLLDPAVVNETFTQYQQIRGFYNFPEKLDVDRYVVDGRLQDFVVGVRELDYSRLEGQQTNWVNRHTVFTHGYGFVAAPANTTCDGEPFFVSGILVRGQGQGGQCVAPNDSIVVTQPRIYYGELIREGDFVIVGKPDGAPDTEFDRPQGDSQENYTYTGLGGVPINSLFRRMLYGLYFWDVNFLLYDGFNENSKILYHRNPRDRVQRVAPFLTLDGDPYPAVINGRVVWILDGYTTSSNYPYSQVVDLRQATSDALSDRGTILQARQNVNYMRNSVKATVDAYDGTVTLYAFDESDPVLRAWNQAFGGNIIKPHSAIPPELAAHFRYPEDLFKVQRDLLAKFHVSDPVQFNNGQDFWEVPNDPAASTDAGGPVAAKQPPYYLLTQFPGVTEPRFQLTAAMTPRDRQNLAALLTGVITPDGLQLEMLELPRDGRIPGPGQAQQQMITNNDVIQQITYLSGQGQADFIYGNLLSLPYGGGLLYVQPVYLKSSISTQIPLMRLVLVSYGNHVSFAPTLREAINKLVASAPSTEPPSEEQPPPEEPPSGTPTPTTPPPTVGDIVMTPELQAALDRLDAAIARVEEAQRSGDFAAYGAALAELQAAMDAVKAAQEAARSANTPVTTPSPTG